MRKITKILAGVLSLAVMGASVGALAGCGGNKTTIRITGSTSVNEIMEDLAKVYGDANKNVRIEINAQGSGIGIEDTIAGRNEIGMSSRDLKDEEKKKGIQGKQLCIDGIVLAVAKDCAATKVTNEQVWALAMDGTAFEDNGATISALAGREDSSGTREAFDEKIKDADGKSIKDWGKASPPKKYGSAVSINSSTGLVIGKITSDANKKTLGYISMGSYLANTTTLKALEFKAKDQTEFVAPSVETVKDGSYKMQRPFVIVTKTDSTMSEEVKAFYDWLWSDEAKEIILNKGYVIK